MSRITPSVVNEYYNDSSLTTTTLFAISFCPYFPYIKAWFIHITVFWIFIQHSGYSCCILVIAPSSHITIPMTIKERNCLNFIFVALHFAPALHSRCLLFNTSGFGVLFQVLFVLWKVNLASSKYKQLSQHMLKSNRITSRNHSSSTASKVMWKMFLNQCYYRKKFSRKF